MTFTQKDIDRFWSHVDKSGDCWLWTAYRSKRGYGQFGYFDKVLKAHRVSYEIAFGKIPDGKEICHTCDNPSCVRPSHLFAGTHSENIRDSVNKGRGYLQKHPEDRQGERHPLAKLTEEHVNDIRNSKGKSQSQLAKQYGVCRWTIRRILSRISWKNI